MTDKMEVNDFMTNEEIQKLKDTNELVNNSLVFLLIWEKEYIKMGLKNWEKKQKTFEYLKVIKNLIFETKEFFRNTHNMKIK